MEWRFGFSQRSFGLGVVKGVFGFTWRSVGLGVVKRVLVWVSSKEW